MACSGIFCVSGPICAVGVASVVHRLVNEFLIDRQTVGEFLVEFKVCSSTFEVSLLCVCSCCLFACVV